MKWLLIPLFWLLAVALAVAILWRLWRGQNVVLRGKWSPRIVRMVAVILVVLGVGVEKARPAPAPPVVGRAASDQGDDPLPANAGVALEQWSTWHAPNGAWAKFKIALTRVELATDKRAAVKETEVEGWLVSLPTGLQKLLKEDIDARVAGKSVPVVAPGELLRTLDEMEQTGLFDNWAVAYLWRRTGAGSEEADAAKLIELFARLRRHARLTDALIRVQVHAIAFDAAPETWRGKGGRPPRFVPGGGGPPFPPGDPLPRWAAGGGFGMGRRATGVNETALRAIYATTDAGTWSRDGVVRFTLADDSAEPALLRGGNRWLPRAGQVIRLERLDLIDTPAGKPVILEHEWLGRIELPPGRVVSVWKLPDLLPKEAREKVTKSLDAALEGDEKAAVKLERALPLVHPFLRDRLATANRKPGASRLRMILALFDDAVTPAATSTGPIFRESSPLADPEDLIRRIRNQGPTRRGGGPRD